MTTLIAILLGFVASATSKPADALRRLRHGRRDAAQVLRALVAQRVDRRIAGSPSLSLHAVAEPPRVVPRRVLDDLEARFADLFPAPGQARVAAGLFTSAVALACAGIVGIVSFVAPQKGMTVPRHAAAEQPGGARVAAAAEQAGVAEPAHQAHEAAAGASAPAPVVAAAVAPPEAVANGVLVGEGRGGLPIGKGMWIWHHDRAAGGDPNAIVAKAKTWGFTHLYVRTGTLREGFMAGPFLDRLLPVAHAAGLRVYGWDFPYMNDPGADVNRALAAIRHTTPDGHRIDGFAPDIETKHEGTNESLDAITAYVTWLRENVGVEYPLIAVIPNPTPGRIARGYPFAEIIRPFDAVAPMVYWMNRDPGTDVAHAISFLSQFNKPVFPIGQAYDGAIDGGPAGIPDRAAIIKFMQSADQHGAVSVSFWSWQHASDDAWNAISDAMEFRLAHGVPQALRPSMVLAYQLQLAYLGYGAPLDGQWSPATADAVVRFQRDSKLPETAIIDEATRHALLRPRLATIRPAGH